MKVICTECDWKGQNSDLLSATNPFHEKDIITVCPSCKSIDSTQVACDEEGCWVSICCGTPIKNGYRNTCSKHKPFISNEIMPTRRRNMVELKDFLKVFGEWVVEVRPPDGYLREFTVKELCEIFNQKYIKASQDWGHPYVKTQDSQASIRIEENFLK